jgi:hypothetical protein
LRDRAGTQPLPLHKCILYGMRIAVVGSAGGFVPDVSVVCREAGALVWSAEAGEPNSWQRWHDGPSAETLDSSSQPSVTGRSRRGGAAAAAAGGAAPVATGSSVDAPPRVDLVVVDDVKSLTASLKRSLSEGYGGGGGGGRTAKRLSLPPVVSVKWLLQCLMQQKRLNDAEREEYLLL